MVSMADWSDDIDTHTLSIIFDDDAVYRVEISPSDSSGNTSGYKSSEIFEIDTTLPVVSSKNGILVDEKNALNFWIYIRMRERTRLPRRSNLQT